MKLKLLAMIACSVSLTLAGCGSDSTTEPAGGNNTSYPKATGAITKIAANGDITVGAVTYDTSGAVIDTQGSGDLTEGMTVTVEGPTTGHEGIAHKIKYDSEVEGVVTANDIVIDPTLGEITGTLTVMGQTLIINVDTKFYNKMTDEMIAAPATDIVAGNVVEVSGMMSDVGIVASLVELKAETLEPGEEIEVKGFVTGYDMDLGTFNLGECEVVITPDTKFDGFDMLNEGMYVEVKSTADNISMTGMCTIAALVIENEDEDQAMQDMAKVEGTVTSALDGDAFEMIDGDGATVMVKLQQDIHYVNGDVASIVLDAKLKVKGTYDDMGALLAAKILFEDQNNPVSPIPQGPKIKIDAYVDAVDVTAGTLTVLGQAVMITDLTILAKEPLVIPAPVPADPNNPMPVATGTTTPAEIMIMLGDITVGDYAHILAEVDDAGNLVATLVVVENMSGGEVLMSKIYGSISEATVATNTTLGMMVVEGVKVVVNDVTMIEPVEYDLNIIAESITAGTALEALVKGVYDATTGELTADQIVVHAESTMMM